jgi:hypothetical protein
MQLFNIKTEDRGGEAYTFCMCCQGFAHADDFRPETFTESHREGVERHYCGPVCAECMDDNVYCEDTGAYVPQDDAKWDEQTGEWFQTSEGRAAAEAEDMAARSDRCAEASNLRVSA